MLKLIAPDAWQFDEPVAQQVKVSSRGLRGNDLRDFIKRAGHRFADRMQHIDLHPGEEPIHLLAVGSTEFYGPNRNGDGFKEANCKKYHDTFVKFARWYRSHKNKDPSKGRGIVKLSEFHPHMKRIELLVALNATKEAAERNGGLVADQEMDALARGKPISVSMACKVANDVCSGCGNRAASPADYCDEFTCKYGGLKNNMGVIFDDGHHLHADNPEPQFFDISNVGRPADRIAYVLGRLEKAASAGRILSGAELAAEAGLTLPQLLIDGASWSSRPLAKTANLALDIEEAIGDGTLEDIASNLRQGLHPGTLSPLDDAPPVRGSVTKLAHLVTALAQHNVVLPPEDFLQIVTDGPQEKIASAAAAVRAQLPGIYNRMQASGVLEGWVENNPYYSDGVPPRAFRDWAQKVAEHRALTSQRLQRDTMRASIRGLRVPLRAPVTEKQAAISGPARELAHNYAGYALAALQQIPRTTAEYGLTFNMAILQNYV